MCFSTTPEEQKAAVERDETMKGKIKKKKEEEKRQTKNKGSKEK